MTIHANGVSINNRRFAHNKRYFICQNFGKRDSMKCELKNGLVLCKMLPL